MIKDFLERDKVHVSRGVKSSTPRVMGLTYANNRGFLHTASKTDVTTSIPVITYEKMIAPLPDEFKKDYNRI